MNKKYLDTAIKIGKRLVESAIWENNSCTWMINTPDKEKSKERISKKEIAGGNFYQGTTGMALFLSALYKYDNNKDYVKTAEGAVEYALKEVKNIPFTSFGLHSGRPGIAFVTARFAEYCNKKEYFEKAREVLAPLYGNEDKDIGIDVIGGAGGSIPILLKLSDLLNEPKLIKMCEKLADNLVNIARKELYGWCWLDDSPTHVRCLCGYAHGAAGIGQAFLEMYSYTGKTKYLYAADQAFRYERKHYSNENNNWPDFRHNQIGEFYYAGKMEELKELALTSKVQKYTPKFMNAWCHGAPGIALSRLRAFELTGSKNYKKDAIDALKETCASIQQFEGNYSLCHGLSGNSEPLIMASKLLNESKYIDLAEECILFGIENYEDKELPWPCGTLQGVNDPSFMLGEAGLGYLLLRLLDNNLESVLQSVVNKKCEKIIADFNKYRKIYLDEFFAETMTVLKKRSLINEEEFFGKFDIESEKSDMEMIKEKLTDFVHNLSQENNFIKEIFYIEKIKLEMKNNIEDFTEDFVETLARKPLETDFDNTQKFFFNIKNKMLHTGFNIEEVIESESHNEKDFSGDIEHHYLLYQQSNKIFRKKLNEFAAVTFDSFKKPKNVNEVMNYFKEIFEIESPEQTVQVENALKDQIRQAYFSGILVRKN